MIRRNQLFVAINVIVDMHCTCASVFLRGSTNRIIDGHDYNVMNVQSAIQCGSICAMDAACRSINYGLSTGTCEINTAWTITYENPNILHEAAGWRVYEKAPCGIGVLVSTHCHHVFGNTLPWKQAQDQCEAMGESLAEVYSNDEHLSLDHDLWIAGVPDSVTVWIGLNTTSLTWLSGNPMTFSGFYSFQPSLSGEECVTFALTTSPEPGWGNGACVEPNPFVCQKRLSFT